MFKKIRTLLLGSLLVKGSLAVLAGSSVANIGVYLYHLLMGRLLGPVDYGVLESLISISYLLGIPIGVLGIIIVKYVSQEIAHKERTAAFVDTASQKTALWGGLGLGVFLLAFPWLRSLVKVDSFALFLGVGIASYLSIFLTISSSSLQGIMEFAKLSFFNIFGSWSKLLIALILAALGFRVGGAIAAIALATLLTVVLGYKLLLYHLPLNFFGKINRNVSFEKIGTYSLAVFLSNLALTSLYTMDIVLARHFLTPLEAGGYAALSVLGKIIFFAASPIMMVMFPVVSARQANGENYRKVVVLSLLLVLSVSLGVSSLYFLLPQLMVGLLYGQDYLSFSSSLGSFAIFISLYSLCSLLLNFFLSVSKVKIVALPVILAGLQVILINFYHEGISQILAMNILVTIILLLGLLLYLLKIATLRNYRPVK
jgi:O-antigen/teichoic acid export membrane protein